MRPGRCAFGAWQGDLTLLDELPSTNLTPFFRDPAPLLLFIVRLSPPHSIWEQAGRPPLGTTSRMNGLAFHLCHALARLLLRQVVPLPVLRAHPLADCSNAWERLLGWRGRRPCLTDPTELSEACVLAGGLDVCSSACVCLCQLAYHNSALIRHRAKSSACRSCSHPAT